MAYVIGSEDFDFDVCGWHAVLAYELAKRGIELTDDHDVGDLVNLMADLDAYFGGDTAAASEAVRTGAIAFEARDDWWFIRRN